MNYTLNKMVVSKTKKDSSANALLEPLENSKLNL